MLRSTVLSMTRDETSASHCNRSKITRLNRATGRPVDGLQHEVSGILRVRGETCVPVMRRQDEDGTGLDVGSATSIIARE